MASDNPLSNNAPHSSSANLVGKFLISESDLQDPNFQFTVILMIYHDSDGALGFVLNRPSTAGMGDIFPQFENHPASRIPIFIGGPLQQEYLFLIQRGLDANAFPAGALPGGSVEITGNIYFVPNVQPVLDYLHDSWPHLPYDERPELRFFAGYSGWDSGQVEMELASESWVTHEASSEIIFNPNPENAWRKALQKKGGLYWIMGETGSKPSMN
ncbi:MAG: YqgE/AlgH family protein [Salinispira sp.]